MAITNPTATKSWQKFVEIGVEFMLTTPFNGVAVIEVAPMATDALPADTILGVPLIPGNREGANRTNVGAGYICARVAPGQPVDSAPMVLLTWT